MKYITVYERGEDPGEVLFKIAIEVDKHLKYGFKPIGGISIALDSIDRCYAVQAMIREEEE